MAYIYKITNDINGKVYVGKTEFSLEKRFMEHCRESERGRDVNRPLYSAMRKYGIDHFHIELIEETDKPEEREVYWIEQLRSYKNGYNATLGGDGKRYIDYDKVITLYNVYQNCSKVASILNISADAVRKILHSQQIEVISSQEVTKRKNEKIVAMYSSLNEQPIQVFASYNEAARYLLEIGATSAKVLDGIAAHIRDACLGRRATAYKHYWKIL